MAGAGGAPPTRKGWFFNRANSRLEARYNNTAFLRGTATTCTIPVAATFSSTVAAGAITSTGTITAKSATAVPASAGAVAAGPAVTMFSGSNSIWITSDPPAFTATKGDLCINTGGSSTSTRLYVNNGTTNWVAITTAS